MDAPRNLVATEKDFAYYSRYPFGWKHGFPKEAEDLTCPSCGDDRIAVLSEAGNEFPPAERMLGEQAQCWNCKHTFTITENCWKWRKIGN